MKGKSSEGEKFRKLIKSLQAKGNFEGILTFIDLNGKKHDLANAPENTSIDEMIDHVNEDVWNFDNTHAGTGAIIKLSDKPKTSDDKKKMLRAAIDIRAKNQILRTFISQILDPDFYSTLVSKYTNQAKLIRIDSDNNRDKVVDGNILLLLIAVQICPFMLFMVANIKAKAKALTLADNDHDVSQVIGKYEDLIERFFRTMENAGMKRSPFYSMSFRLVKMTNSLRRLKAKKLSISLVNSLTFITSQLLQLQFTLTLRQSRCG